MQKFLYRKWQTVINVEYRPKITQKCVLLFFIQAIFCAVFLQYRKYISVNKINCIISAEAK